MTFVLHIFDNYHNKLIMENYQEILDQISKDHTGKNFHELLGGSYGNTIQTIIFKVFNKITSQVKPEVRIVEIPKFVEKVVEKIVYVEVEKKATVTDKKKRTTPPSKLKTKNKKK